MDELDISDRLKLAKSTLYQDHMKERLLLQFDELKRDHSTPCSQRVTDAEILLEQIQCHFKGLWDTVEEELMFCINMLGHTEKQDKWQFLFSKPIHIKWISEWTSPGPIISSVLPWFDTRHDWTAMRADDYLKGAKHLVGSRWAFPKLANSNARLVLEEVTRWTTIVTDNACGPFLDQLHLDLAAMKLDILMPNAEEADVTVPASLDADTARQLLKRKGDKSRKTFDGHRAYEALQAFVSKPLPERVPKPEGGRATRQRKGPPDNVSFNVGDEVMITWAKLQDFINTNNCVC